jgi:hypothetical protein
MGRRDGGPSWKTDRVSSPRVSLVLNAGRTVFNTLRKRQVPADATSMTGIVREGPLHFSREQAARFSSFVGWTADGLAPTFPYALLTHLHFALVNDARFPFPPLGLIHKKETVELLAPLTPGVWSMRCVLSSVAAVERGFELAITSELTVDGRLSWRSTTLAFKRTKAGAAGPSKPRPRVRRALEQRRPDSHERLVGAADGPSRRVDARHVVGGAGALGARLDAKDGGVQVSLTRLPARDRRVSTHRRRLRAVFG